MATLRDPYLVLGVGRTATPDELKQAYRKLAKQYHPDLNPGRSDIEQRFKEVSAAYSLLSDPVKRRRFDQGEIDAAGNDRADHAFHRAHAGRSRGRAGAGAGPDPFGGFSADDIFADLFGNRREARGRGSDIEYSVTVSFLEAAIGAKRRISLSNGKSIDLTIPPGTESEQKLRLKGQGMPGGGQAGDAIIEIQVEPHPFFSRKGRDVLVEVPITLPEAILGATIKVPTLSGTVALKVPRGSNTGTSLRLKGKGITDAKQTGPGDLYVTLKVVLPDPPDTELSQFIEKWSQRRTYDVRKKAGFE